MTNKTPRQQMAILYSNKKSYQQVMSMAFCQWYCRNNPDYKYKPLPVDCDAVQFTAVQPLPEDYRGKMQL